MYSTKFQRMPCSPLANDTDLELSLLYHCNRLSVPVFATSADPDPVLIRYIIKHTMKINFNSKDTLT